MRTKFIFSSQTWDHESIRLTNQIFKILPMYEKEEDWVNQRDTIALQLKGYNEALVNSPDFMVLIGKLGALSHAENRFSFRKLIFEAISALKEIKL